MNDKIFLTKTGLFSNLLREEDETNRIMARAFRLGISTSTLNDIKAKAIKKAQTTQWSFNDCFETEIEQIEYGSTRI